MLGKQPSHIPDGVPLENSMYDVVSLLLQSTLILPLLLLDKKMVFLLYGLEPNSLGI